MNDRPAPVLLILILFLAAIVRLSAALQADFPLNDGGLFYVMIETLRQNGFLLPETVAYTHPAAPFAYPPLAFYLTAALAVLTPWSTLDLLRVLPSLISLVSLPLVFLLGKRLNLDERRSTYATLAFAFTPMAFEWQVMGGGITRSLGQVFFLTTMIALLDYLNQPKRKPAFFLILSAALVILSHPEAALQTALSAVCLILLKGGWRSVWPTLRLGWIALGLAAPWWGMVLIRFGPAPFLAVFQAAGQDSSPFIRPVLLIQGAITAEPFLTLTAVLGWIGLFLTWAKGERTRPIWFLVTFLADPRSGVRFAMIPMAFLAAETLLRITDALPLPTSRLPPLQAEWIGSRLRQVWLGWLVITWVVSAFTTMQRIATRYTLTFAERQTMLWLHEHTPPEARLAAITGGEPLLDPYNEWLPALAERHSLTTVFGYEWIHDGQFGNRLQAYRHLQKCAFQESDCVQTWIEAEGRVDFLVLLTSREDQRPFPLQIALESDPRFEQVYRNEQVQVYRLKP